MQAAVPPGSIPAPGIGEETAGFHPDLFLCGTVRAGDGPSSDGLAITGRAPQLHWTDA